MENFYIKTPKYNRFYKNVKSNNFDFPSQHFLITGPAGIGKSSFVRSIKIDLEKDKSENDFKILRHNSSIDFEIVFSEIKDFVNGSKGVFVIDDSELFLERLTETESQILREYLQTSTGFILIMLSRSIPLKFYDYNYPLYEFFKVVKIDNFKIDDANRLIELILKGLPYESIIGWKTNHPILWGSILSIGNFGLLGSLTSTVADLIVKKGEASISQKKMLLDMIDKILRDSADVFDEKIKQMNHGQTQILEHFSFPDGLTINIERVPDSTTNSPEFKSNVSQLMSWNIVSLDRMIIRLIDVPLFLYLTRIYK